MDIILAVKAIIMGLVEGFTEFLPISSTGHLILAGSLINFTGEVAQVFEIAIQAGAMLAVIWEYRARIGAVLGGIASDKRQQRFMINLIVAFIPAAVLGFLFSKAIKAHLFKPEPVAAAFIVGALVILWAERRHKVLAGSHRIETVDEMTIVDALKVGCAQCFALIPGTSRSGATIIGAMVFGFSRKAAAEFSFFLAVPTLIGAGAYSVWKDRAALSMADLPTFAVGTVFAFFSAWLCIRWLIRFVSSHDFTVFAWYRIVFGGIVLLSAATGWVTWRA
jgi:undecaprenyl-diphosphatase